MLYVSGNLGGTFYEDKAVPYTKFVELFNIPMPRPGMPMMFKVEGKKVKREDKNNGGTNYTPGRKEYPAFTVNTTEGPLTVRYAETRTPQGNGVFKYMPRKVLLVAGTEFTTVTADQPDKAVFFYLHPRCSTSPWARRTLYRHYDPEAEAERQNLQLEQNSSVISEIFSLPENTLRLRAAGIKYRVQNTEVDISNAATIGAAQLRQMLARFVMNHGQRFVQAWDESKYNLRGLTRMAIHYGVIRQEVGRDNVRWVFNEDNGGGTIVSARKGQDALAVLLTEFNATAQQSIDTLMRALQAHLFVETKEAKKEDVAETEMSIPALVDAAAEIGALTMEGSQIFTTKTNGAKNLLITTVTDVSLWKEEMVKFLSNTDNKDSLAEVKKAFDRWEAKVNN